MTAFSTADIPNLSGRRAAVTGATGGLGFETAAALAGAGAEVFILARNGDKAARAKNAILARTPDARLQVIALDLANLSSVRAGAEALKRRTSALDILVNNAGVMSPPRRTLTADGFETQFGTNHLGHFLLTAELLPVLRHRGARVVTVSSLMHRVGDLDFSDLQWARGYRAAQAYGASKLANLLFAKELQRRSDAHGWGLLSAAAHPGAAATDLIANGPGLRGAAGRLATASVSLIGHSAAAWALSSLYAATAPGSAPGGYYGPSGGLELKGPPSPAIVSKRAQDPVLAGRLWDVSVALTGAVWPA